MAGTMYYNSESQIPANAAAAGWTLTPVYAPAASKNYLVPLVVLAIVVLITFMAMRRR